MRNIILLTGATGALGSELLRRFLAKGDQVVCLVRGKGDEMPKARIEQIVGKQSNVRVVEGDICEPRCGIKDVDRELWRHRISRIVHCAASISFDDPKETHAANVEGVKNVLELAEVLGVDHFHHVSTAYVGGGAENEFSEDDLPSSITYRPRNSYEETKQIGETLVRAWVSSNAERRFAIYRPSILIGRQDGTTPTFDAYYGYFRPIHAMVQKLRERKQIGKLLPPDINIEDDGRVEIPLVLSASPAATLNLVPIDWVADTMVELSEVPPTNSVYHQVNLEPPLVRWVIDTSLAHLKVDGVTVAENEEAERRARQMQSPFVSRLQRQLDPVLELYRPYTSHGTQFTSRNTEQALGERFYSFRSIDAAFLDLLLDNALEANWGGASEKKAVSYPA